MQNTAQLFFENYIGERVSNFTLLAQSGSSRKNYIGETLSKKYIITENENIRENEAFLYLSKIFTELKLNTPFIFAVNDDRSIYTQEYLGDKTLSQILTEEDLISEKVRNLIKLTLTRLYELQIKTKNKIDFKQAFEYEIYDELPIIHDLYYFKNFLVDVLELPYHKSNLLKEFISIKNLIVDINPVGLMMRDFQSRNIMVNDDQVFFIDYQGAMKGPLMYDVISFLYQAKANFPQEFKNEMLSFYINLWGKEQAEALKSAINPLLLMRYLQVLGAYGLRGIIQRKAHFIESLDLGIQNIFNLSQEWDAIRNFPELYQIIQQLKTASVKSKIKYLINA